MYASVSHPPAASPSPEVLAYKREILAKEGPYTVEERYYTDPADADRERRWVAERMLRGAQRRAEYAKLQASVASAARPRVTTWLTPREQQRVEAAGGEQFASIHRTALGSVRADLALGHAEAALVSAALVEPSDVPALTALVRGFPACTVAGLIADADDSRAISGTLLLGHAGVTRVVDGRVPSGWPALRSTLESTQFPRAFQRDALGAVFSTIGTGDADLPTGCVRFFRAIFAPSVTTAKGLAADLGILPTTLVSRFYRAGLPTPKQYIATARLAWAAHLAESPALSIAGVALRLDASSPQSFGRTVKTMTGLTAVQFRAAYNGAAMLDRFCSTLVRPYRDTLRAFDPLSERLSVPVYPHESAAASTPLTGMAA